MIDDLTVLGTSEAACGARGWDDGSAALLIRELELWAWRWDLASGALWFSDGWEKLLGYTTGELPSRPELFELLSHPDDRAPTIAKLHACLRGDTAAYHSEHRLRTSDGAWRWFADRARVVARDLEGRATVMIGMRTDISDRKFAELRLAESERHHRLFVQTNTAAFWTRDPDGTLTFLDEAVAASFGLPQRLVRDGVRRDPVHPDDWSDLASRWQEAEARAEPFECEHRMRMRNGGYRWVHAKAYPALDGEGRIERWYGATNIIDDRKVAELQLRRSEEHLRSILSTVPDAIIVMNESGVVRSFSTGAEAMFGYGAHEIVGRGLGALMAPEMMEMHERGLARYLATDEARVVGIRRTLEARRKCGDLFPVEIFVGEAQEGGERVFSAFLRDLTERRRTEQRLRELQEEVALAGRTGAMIAMASAIAHELNQPLAAASNYLAAFQIRNGEAASRLEGLELLQASHDQIIRAGSVLRHLRKFIERGELERSTHSLRRIVEDACSLTFVGPHRCVAVTIDIDDASDLVEVDRVQVQQVLFNLLRNAAEALSERSGASVRITGRVVDGRVRVMVSDNGPGLPQARRANPFEPLSSQKEGGMGVGLSIAQMIVEAHGGRIGIDSSSSEGCTIRLDLPVSDNSQLETAAVSG